MTYFKILSLKVQNSFRSELLYMYNYELETQSKVTQNIFLISRPIWNGVLGLTKSFLNQTTYIHTKQLVVATIFSNLSLKLAIYGLTHFLSDADIVVLVR